uniref:Uncharacterized protein n=1 Tax=Cyprinodon variegatus TaxID=28743 RepID=A0A3Q2DQS8_CYPVA
LSMQPTILKALESKLEALQCHFTWDLEPTKSKLNNLRYALEDIGTDEGNVWLGHISNLQGFIQYKLGSSEEALSIFRRANETFQRLKNSDEGPWLIVNFGNLAWLNHLMGEDKKSQDYLSKVEALIREYPAPPEEELYSEVCAEKAWTISRFDKEKKLQAAELFQKAVMMHPDNVEWQTSWAIISADPFLDNMEDMPLDVFEKLRFATERDPENLYVAALYLRARAAKGEQIRREARVLAKRILERSPSSYHGINQLRRLYRDFISKDEAIKLADEYLRRYPDSRYAKKSAAICNKMKVLSPDFTPSRLNQITLLLDIEDLDSAEKQMLYHCYARYSFFNKNNSRRSIEYHMEAAKIPVESSYRQTSINELEKTLKRNNYPSKSWKGTQTDPELIEKITKLLTNLVLEKN